MPGPVLSIAVEAIDMAKAYNLMGRHPVSSLLLFTDFFPLNLPSFNYLF